MSDRGDVEIIELVLELTKKKKIRANGSQRSGGAGVE
jgi:hypothetical protein